MNNREMKTFTCTVCHDCVCVTASSNSSAAAPLICPYGRFAHACWQQIQDGAQSK